MIHKLKGECVYNVAIVQPPILDYQIIKQKCKICGKAKESTALDLMLSEELIYS